MWVEKLEFSSWEGGAEVTPQNSYRFSLIEVGGGMKKKEVTESKDERWQNKLFRPYSSTRVKTFSFWRLISSNTTWIYKHIKKKKGERKWTKHRQILTIGQASEQFKKC